MLRSLPPRVQDLIEMRRFNPSLFPRSGFVHGRKADIHTTDVHGREADIHATDVLSVFGSPGAGIRRVYGSGNRLTSNQGLSRGAGQMP